MLIHTLSAGETLESVAQRYNVAAERLAFDNNLPQADRLPIGLPLAIPEPTLTHTVAVGETLFGIAVRYGKTVNSLYRNNLFLNGDPTVFPGQTLFIEQRNEPLGNYETGGYAYPFIPDYLLDRSAPFMKSLIPFTYGFRKDGSLISPEDTEMLEAAIIYGSRAVMHLSTLDENDNFSVPLAQELLNSTEIQRKLLDSVLSNMLSKGYTALDVDFEFLGRENAAKYAEFIAYCRQRLAQYSFPVLVALAPKTSDNQVGALYEGHDYALLGEAADAVLLMTYEWGYTYGPPMAVSPIQPVGKVVDYALTRIPANKIYLGISNYGYDFILPYVQGVSKADSLSTKQAFDLASLYNSEIFFDEAAMAPYFEYTAEGALHRVWFEDIRSISARLRLMAEKNLRGALWWNLNRENNQNLLAVGNLIGFI